MSRSSNRRCLRKDQVEDCISNLSDAILCHILSLVPTKSAVKTCILSKRWKYVWTQVPTLDFTEMPYSKNYENLTRQQKMFFRSFIDRVLLHNDVSGVGCLRFDPLPGEEVIYVKSWLSAIARREFHKIEISTYASIGLPWTFLSSETLMVLKLDGSFVIQLPVSLHLPKLEILHLLCLEFPGDEFMKRLSSSCPVLRELLINKCRCLTDTLYVESLTLKKLEIRRPMGNAELPPCIVIKAPNLEHLVLYGIEIQSDNCDLSSLIEADLDLFGTDGQEPQILRKLCRVNTLQLARMPLILERVSHPPIFQNLTCLKLWGGTDACKILECAPKLTSLIFKRPVWSWASGIVTVPECLSCLESVEMCTFFGLEDEMRFVEYLLKSASALKELKVTFFRLVPKEEVYERLLSLLMFPRSSAACQVKVLNDAAF